MLGLDDERVAAAAQHPYRLRLDELAARVAVVGIDLDDATLDLRHDLLGDHDAIAVLQRRALGVGGVGDERREHVTGTDLGDAVERHERERVHRYATAASVSRASAAATRASIINVSATCARIPNARISSARDASTVSSTNAPQKSWYRRATPTHDGSSPRSAKSRSAGPFTAEPAMSGLTATTRSRAATSASRTPGIARIGPTESTGLARADHDGLRGGERLEHSRRRPRGVGAVEPDVEHRGLAPLPNEPLLHRELDDAGLARGGDPGGHAVVGHREQAAREPPGGGDLGGDRRQRRPRPQALGAEQVRRKVLVAEPEPRVDAVTGEGAEGGKGLTRQAPTGLGVVGPGKGVGHRVEIGADEQAVEPVIVARVHDHRDLARIDHVEQAAEEAGGSHATGERHDHGVKVVERPEDRRS